MTNNPCVRRRSGRIDLHGPPTVARIGAIARDIHGVVRHCLARKLREKMEVGQKADGMESLGGLAAGGLRRCGSRRRRLLVVGGGTS